MNIDSFLVWLGFKKATSERRIIQGGKITSGGDLSEDRIIGPKQDNERWNLILDIVIGVLGLLMLVCAMALVGDPSKFIP